MQVAQCWSLRGRQLELSRDQFNVPMNGQKKSSLMAALIDQADPREGASRPHRRIGVEAFGRGVPPSPQGQRTNDKFRTIWNERLSVIDSDDEPSVRPTGGQNVVPRISSGDAIVATVPASPATMEAAGRRCADVHSFVVIHDEGVPSAVPCQPSQSPFGSIGMLNECSLSSEIGEEHVECVFCLFRCQGTAVQHCHSCRCSTAPVLWEDFRPVFRFGTCAIPVGRRGSSDAFLDDIYTVSMPDVVHEVHTFLAGFCGWKR